MTDETELVQNSMLFLAIRTKTLTSTQLDSIIEHGGNINTKDANDRHNTPLHVASSKGDSNIVRLLLNKGAMVSEKNSSGQTPLDVAQGSDVVNILQQCSQNVPKQKSAPASHPPPIQQSSTTEIFYPKRSGTSGLGGQLYETKLLTLILFRALNRKNIVEFYLGSNVDGLGALDDVVFWFRDSDGKTRMQFIQAKHRDDPDKDGNFTLGEILKEKGDYSIHKYFDSYLSIRRKFGSKSDNNPIFKEEFKKVDCDFVIYTSAKENFKSKTSLVSETTGFNTNRDDILYSTDRGKTFKFDYSPEDVKTIAEIAAKSRLHSIGISLANFVLSGRTENIMSDNLMKTYHVVLAQKLFEIVETGEMTFKADFFESKENEAVILREAMYETVLEDRKQSIRDPDLQNYLKVLLKDPTAENVSKLLGNVLRYDSSSSTLTPIKNRVKLDPFQKTAMKNMKVTQETVQKATEIIGRSTLESLKVKFPPTFGNLDFPLRKSKQEQRIKHLVERFKILFQLAAEHDNVVTIDDSIIGPGKILNGGDIGINGGFAGMVGNILILDPMTNLLKFNLDENYLQPNAKMLLELLKSEIGNSLEEYRLNIKVDYFSRLMLENKEEDEHFSKCFLDNLVFYTDQGKENEVETILKNEIKTRYNISDDTDCDAVFLKVHDKVQHLWKQQREAPFLTMNCDYFDAAVVQMRDNPPLANISAICTSQINKYQIDFNSETVQQLVSNIGEGITNIVSSHVEQTCIKVLQHFGSDSHRFITSNYLKNVLPHLQEVSQLKTERYSCETIIIAEDQKTVAGIAEILNEFKNSKIKVIVITKEKLPNCFNHIEDNGSVFSDLTQDSQIKILKRREISFQGIIIKLGQLLTATQYKIINADMLALLISNHNLKIAERFESAKYENISDFLIQRKLKRQIVQIKSDFFSTKSDLWVNSIEDFHSKCDENENTNVHLIDEHMIWQKTRGYLGKVREHNDSSYEQFTFETLDSLDARVVIVAAEPGMGKSTLMTELMERIKQKDPLSWVVRIDLLDFSKEFSRWKGTIDIPHAINFLLNVQNILPFGNNNLLTISSDNTIVLKDASKTVYSGKELFETELFLHCYNQGNVVLLFDGYDEISPDYKEQALKLLINLKNLKTNKLWVATRNDNNHYELEDNLSTFSYNLESFSQEDKINYLQKFWCFKLMIKNVDNDKFELFVSKLMNLLSNSLNDTEQTFMGIPLQMRMVATIFQTTFQKYYEHNQHFEEIERSKLNVVMLYENFFRIKFDEILFGEKALNINKEDPKFSKMIIDERELIIDRHEKLALCALLDDEELNVFLNSNEVSTLLEYFKSGSEKIGLVCQVVKDKPRFVHQTFAEYFAARYLWNKFTSSIFDSVTFTKEMFVKILTKRNRYQVCYFLQQIAIKDIEKRTDFTQLHKNIDCLLKSLIPCLKKYSYDNPVDPMHHFFRNHYSSFDETEACCSWDENVANRCARLLLKLIDLYIFHSKHGTILSIEVLNEVERSQLFSAAASEGCENLILKFVGLSKPYTPEPSRSRWSYDPLLKAAANGHFKTVEILLKEFYENASKWIDKDMKTLKQHIFSDSVPNLFHFADIFALVDGSPYLDEDKNENFPIIKLLIKHAPSQLIKQFERKTDFKRLNNHKIPITNTPNIFYYSSRNYDVIDGLSLCLLAYDVDLIEDFKRYGADFSQSINSLMSQYCYRAVIQADLFGKSFNLNHIYKQSTIWGTLFHKLKQYMKSGVGYNRKDSRFDLSTRQFIEQAYYIHMIIKKVFVENKFPSKFDVMLKLIIKCIKTHNLLGSSTYLTILNYYIALTCSELKRNYRILFGTQQFNVAGYPDTHRFVTSDKIISFFNDTVKKYKETIEQGKFPHQIIFKQDFDDNDKKHLISWIQKVVDIQTKQNCIFEDALLRVSQEMQRSCDRLRRMLEMSGVTEAKDVKIFDTKQILDILDLQEVETTEKMEYLVTKVIDCKGLSLISTLMHFISLDPEEWERFVQDAFTFTEQAPQIYNFWMNLDQQYHQLLQTIQTDCQAVRNILNQVDPDFRRAVINGQDPEYGSPLHYATAGGNLELVKTLLEFGADSNARLDETKPTPHLKAKTDEFTNFKHFRPLHFAAMCGHEEIVRILLENGAEIDVMTDSGWMPVGLAKKYGHENIVKQLSFK